MRKLDRKKYPNGRSFDTIREFVNCSEPTYNKMRAICKASKEYPEIFGHLVLKIDMQNRYGRCKIEPVWREFKKIQNKLLVTLYNLEVKLGREVTKKELLDNFTESWL